MSGLTRQDLNILEHYAKETKNRELYWNYLAHLPGNDGYGLLALGVVRNDNMPGKVANAYAQQHGGRTLTEREWEAFGQQLIQEDYKRRQIQFEKNDNPQSALNLPVWDVQRAHDITFDLYRLDPNAWTPRQLLEAARRQDGERAAERIWSNMLDNSALGLHRANSTLSDIRRYLPWGEGTRYLGHLGLASALAANARDDVDPDTIGANNFYYRYDARDDTWSVVSNNGAGAAPLFQEVSDAKQLEALNDIRQLRLERQQKSSQFHADDPHRQLLPSPKTLAQGEPPPDAQPPDARQATQQAESAPAHPPLPPGFAPALWHGPDIRQPDHPGHDAYTHTLKAVRRMEAEQGIAPGPHTEWLAARLAAEAAERRQGITRVEMDKDGRIHAIERHYAEDEGRRFGLPAAEATSIPVETSGARWLAAKSAHYVSTQPPAERTETHEFSLRMLPPDDRAMFSALRGQTPAHVGDAVVAQALLEAKRSGIHDAERVAGVTMLGDQLHVIGTTPGQRIWLNVTAEAPPLQESIQQTLQANQQREEQLAAQNQQQVQQQTQARALSLG
ncbi:hypothetical protein EBB59_12280 [Lysobacter pythonis]|uniref:X-Tfes XVIPCD domain-containing protein n=1 Tax=Solilutibacter pythonis TaxID=2483112 RepID=A0A3M2HDX4_9GAMM|nr:XVIPCD domain-containing protein [Lysobacter pythonis]RMH87911.1 hypothetical protein EBB59_12280 [Lysobacter pythonis]